MRIHGSVNFSIGRRNPFESLRAGPSIEIMSAKANYFKLGVFILAGFGLALGAVLLLGASRLLEKKVIIETYLDQSVQGIDIGSKVKYRGVPIGTVRKVSFTKNHYAQQAKGLQHSYVLLELELTAVPFGEMTPDTIQDDLPKEVRHGLRSRLTAQGVTGTSYLEIDYLDAERYPALPIDWEPKNPYLPSAPSAFAQIVNSAEEVFSELERINFTKIAGGVEQLIDSLERKVGDLPLATLGTNAVSLLAEVRDSNRQLRNLLERPEIGTSLKDLSAAVANLRRTTELPGLTNSVVRLERTLGRLEGLLAGKDDAVESSLENLRSLTENLRELSENAKRFPAQVLFGEPPKPLRNP